MNHLLTIAMLAATALAGTDGIASDPFALAPGQKWSDADSGVSVTLRSMSDDSGCLTKTDCSQMLFNGSVVIEQGENAPALSTVQAVMTPQSSVQLPFPGGRVELLGVATKRGVTRASFRLVMDPPAPPRPLTYLELAPADRIRADESFLASHAQRQGVRTTPSGLQYAVIDAGTGRTVEAGSSVAIEYSAVLSDGTPVTDQPTTVLVGIPADALVPGLNEGVMLMSEGSRYRFVLPPGIAVDAKGRRGRLHRLTRAPDDAVLVFDVRVANLWGR